MSFVYVLKNGGLVEVFGSVSAAYEAAVACFDVPAYTTVEGDKPQDMVIEYHNMSLAKAKAEIKRVGYMEIEEYEDSENGKTVEIEKCRVLR